MFTALMLQLASAQSLTLTIHGEPAPGELVTMTIEGLTPGEPAFLAASDELGETCPMVTAPYCTDLERPRVLARGTPSTSSVTLSVDLPANFDAVGIQAISPSGVSTLFDVEEVSIHTGDVSDLPPMVVGVAITCDIDEVDMIAQYMGVADTLRADAWLDGAVVASHDLTIESAPEGSIFFDAVTVGSAPSCDDVTWVVEASNPSITTCVVRGDEADDLRATGAIDGACANI